MINGLSAMFTVKLVCVTRMPKFKIMKPAAKGKSWKAVGKNPKTGRQMTIHGGQAGRKVGAKARGKKTAQAFDKRHDATGMTPKKYINKRRWDGKAKIGSTVNIPTKYFK